MVLSKYFEALYRELSFLWLRFARIEIHFEGKFEEASPALHGILRLNANGRRGGQWEARGQWWCPVGLFLLDPAKDATFHELSETASRACARCPKLFSWAEGEGTGIKLHRRGGQ